MATAGSVSDAGETRAPILVGVVLLLLVISMLMVGLRVSCRLQIDQFGPDDFAAVLALICILGCGSSMIAMTWYGLGKHQWTLSDETFILYLRGFWVSIFFYMMTLVFVKLTFLLHYYRLMSVSNMRPLFLAALVIVALWGVSQFIMAFIECIPLEAVWDHRVNGRCIPHTVTLWYFNGVFNIATDVSILVLPLPILWKLQLPPLQKGVLAGIFGLGFL
ncbi:hypothetical protein G7046_g10087 [Stylonectria norvegica]|nr:hypothetical protein G7046_g10087 [Stylonectria norvegica]